MDQHRDDDDQNSLNDDPILGASLVAELERVLGPLDWSSGRFQWLLPISGIAEMLALLREAPTGLGVVGLEQLLRDRLGSLSALKRLQPDSGDADV